jgi:hypothetical protein
MGDGLTLSKQEEQRAIVLGQVGVGILSIAEASALVGVSKRQVSIAPVIGPGDSGSL